MGLVRSVSNKSAIDKLYYKVTECIRVTVGILAGMGSEVFKGAPLNSRST